MTGGYYRPLTVHHMRAGLDADGTITGWLNTVANQSIIAGSLFEPMLMPDGLDATAYEGSNELPYDVGPSRLSWAQMESPVPVLWWRSVGHTHTAYAVETFLDELLLAAGKDPVQGRLDLMKEDRPRDRAVLERVAEMAGWSGPGTGDRRLGVAVVRSFGSYVAQIAEVEDRDGMPHVTRVWCAVDCGVAVTPDVIRAQMEGGIGYGLGTRLSAQRDHHSPPAAACSRRITTATGCSACPRCRSSRPRSSSSAEPPTGVGEPGTPPIAPAVSNAWRALTGAMPYRLPYRAARV